MLFDEKTQQKKRNCLIKTQMRQMTHLCHLRS